MRVRPIAMAPIREHRRTVAALLLFLYLPACTSWQVGKPSPEEFLENEQPEKVRVTQTDGSRFELMSPAVRADSLVGRVNGGTSVSIALSEVQKIEVSESDSAKDVLELPVRVSGDAVASESVNDRIGRLIRNEDSRRPLSDQRIAEMLKVANINIARRTVTKYRESLNLLSSTKRREVG